MITHDNWPERWEDISPGTEISQEIYDKRQMARSFPDLCNVRQALLLRRNSLWR